jgi:hypothetical protein
MANAMVSDTLATFEGKKKGKIMHSPMNTTTIPLNDSAVFDISQDAIRFPKPDRSTPFAMTSAKNNIHMLGLTNPLNASTGFATLSTKYRAQASTAGNAGGITARIHQMAVNAATAKPCEPGLLSPGIGTYQITKKTTNPRSKPNVFALLGAASLDGVAVLLGETTEVAIRHPSQGDLRPPARILN